MMAKNRTERYLVGVDLGATKILAGVLDSDGTVCGRSKNKTKAEQSKTTVLERIDETIREALKDGDINLNQVTAIGIGAPGLLDANHGVVKYAPNLGWKNVDLKSYLEKELGVFVFVENDVNAGTFGEHRFGAGRGISDVMGIFVGTGIGGGLVLDNRLHRGFNQTAGEIGHTVIAADGPICSCGRRGCLEAVAARWAIGKNLRKEIASGRKSFLAKQLEKKGGRIKSRWLQKAILREDPLAMEVVRKAARYLGISVSGIIQLVNPQMIILGGGVVEALGDFYVNEVRKSVMEFAFPDAARGVMIEPSRLGDDAVLLGAAELARLSLEQKDENSTEVIELK